MLYSHECKMTAMERQYLKPLFNLIDNGFKKFKLYFPSGDVIIVDFFEYHEAYYDDDIFEIDFYVVKLVRNITKIYEKGCSLSVSLANYPSSVEVVG